MSPGTGWAESAVAGWMPVACVMKSTRSWTVVVFVIVSVFASSVRPPFCPVKLSVPV